MWDEDDEAGDVMSFVYNIVINNDVTVGKSRISGPLIIIGNNTRIENNFIECNNTSGPAVLTMGVNETGMNAFVKKHYEQLVAGDDIKKIILESEDMLAVFNNWILTQPQLLDNFVIYLTSKVDNETMTRVME